MVCLSIDSINYVTGVGNGSREPTLVIYALANNLKKLEVFFEQFKQKSEFFTKNQAPGVLVSILTLTYSLLCFN